MIAVALAASMLAPSRYTGLGFEGVHVRLTYRLEWRSGSGNSRPLLQFTIRNNGDAPVWLLKWLTPLEGLYADILTITCDGQRLPYRGPMVKRGNPQPEDYVLLDPGAGTSATVDLTANFDLPTGVSCSVDFTRGQVMATEHNPAGATTPPDFVQVSGNPVQIYP